MKYDLNEFLMTINITIIFIILIIYMNYGIAFIDYTLYRINSSEYELVEGIVTDLNYVNILPAKGTLETGAIYFSNADISYTINGNDYLKTNLKAFSDKQKGDAVLLAIKNNTVRRGEPYKLSFVEKIIIICLILCIIIFILIQIYKIKRNHNSCREIKCRDFIKESEDYKKQIVEKQQIILNAVTDISINNRKENIIDYLIENQIYLNKACSWYIQNKIYLKGILINSTMDAVRDCITTTMDMRSHGMSENFYVIEKFDNYCFCCSKENEIIYCYSKNIGLTNTKYFDFYDYIIDKIKGDIG